MIFAPAFCCMVKELNCYKVQTREAWLMKLSVNNLTFSYEDKNIIRDLSFEVQDGEFVSILGPSGCGKSTLLNVLAGIRKAESGEVQIDGETVCGISSKFAYMPQNDLLFPWKTILENVCLYGEIHHCKEQMKEEARSRMAQFGLEGCEQKYPSELSGGMRQRAAFLRTALCDAGIFLLDEPFGALDVITRGEMQDWLRQLCSEMNRTILLVTHDTDEAIFLSDRILIFGEAGEGIRKEIVITEPGRTRKWLYEQGELRANIHQLLTRK